MKLETGTLTITITKIKTITKLRQDSIIPILNNKKYVYKHNFIPFITKPLQKFLVSLQYFTSLGFLKFKKLLLLFVLPKSFR